MASKGVVRTGEAYCLSCYQLVDRGAEKCPGCLSDFELDVKAFFCPKCKTVMALGDPKCPKCGLKFKVKTLKARETAQDDQFLMKLIEWGKAPGEEGDGTPGEQSQTVVQATPRVPSPDDRRIERLSVLKASIKDLMANRSEMLERMEKRFEAEKTRLEKLSDSKEMAEAPDHVEAEIMALADEMADITMLQAHMDSLSDEISALMDSVDVSEATKERGLAARALKKKLEAKEKELVELRDKEDQLAKREEMVDRKIQSYAQKKKQLDDNEESLKVRLAKLEEERGELERLKSVALAGRTESEREEARGEWLEEQKRLRQRLRSLKSTFETGTAAKEVSGEEPASAEGDLNSMISELEGKISDMISEKAELQKKIMEARQVDDDMRALLKVLDQMLGQLPEEVIERFSKSDDFSIYERVLDRFNI